MVRAGGRLTKGNTLTIQVAPDGESTLDLRVGEAIAEGGSGSVFEGRDPRGRAVIIKVPKNRGAAGLAFHVEREIFRKLDSPNLPRLIGWARTPSGLALVFERVYLNPLHFINRRERRPRIKAVYDSTAHYVPLPGPTALELGRELLLALRHLHRRGFAHCDVKLGNLMIRLDHGESTASDHDYVDRVKRGAFRGVLIDGGGVRSVGYLASLNEGEEDPNLVAPQCTPIFAPPETVLEPHIYSRGMDVYAAGLAIYTMVTGHTPYSHLERRIDPSDLLNVWEFKQAERRGDIRPISAEVIARVFYPDSDFEGGAEARGDFDERLFRLLSDATDPDPERRASSAALLNNFSELFLFTSNKVGPRFIRVDAGQGIFHPDSTQRRLDESISPEGEGRTARLRYESGEMPVLADLRLLEEQTEAEGIRTARIRPGALLARSDEDTTDEELEESAMRALEESAADLSASTPAPTVPPRSGQSRPGSERGRRPGQRPSDRHGESGVRRRRGARPSRVDDGSTERARARRETSRPDAGRPDAGRPDSGRRARSPEDERRRERRRGTARMERGVGERGVGERGSGDARTARLAPSRVSDPGADFPQSATRDRDMMTAGERIEPWLQRARAPREVFLRRHPSPVLFLEETVALVSSQEAPTREVRLRPETAEEPCLFRVGTAETRPDAAVTLGRSVERDIQVRSPSVSKLHCAFARDSETGRWMISDLGSTNGTRVDGHKLRPLVPALLADLARVTFGEETFVFFTAEGLYDYLASLLEATGGS